MKRKVHPVIFIILGLAIFGLVHQLIFNTVQFITYIIIFGGIILVLYLLYRNFMRKQYGVPKKKQSYQSPTVRKNGYNVVYHRPALKRKQNRQRPLQRRSSAPHLTVIEGKKGKKKNRALF